MAHLLYRLGRTAYRKRWWFISAWLVILLAVGGATAAFMGKLSDSFDLPGTATQQTVDRMKDLFPDAATDTGTVVLESADGNPFTDAQRAAITAALANLQGTSQVTEATDPFSQQAELDKAAVDVEKGRADLAAGEKSLEDGRRQLADGLQQLADGRAEIAKNEPLIAEGEEQLAQGERELQAGRDALADGRATLAAEQKKYDEGVRQYQAGLQQIADTERELASGQAQIDQGRAEWDAQSQQLASLEQTVAMIGEQCAGDEACLDESAAEYLGMSWADAQRAAATSRTELDAAKSQLDTLQQQVNDGRAQLADAQAGMPAAQQQLEAGRAQLDQGRAELRNAEREVADGEAQLTASRAELQSARDQLAAGKQQIADTEARIPGWEAELADGERKLADGRTDLALGERTAKAIEGLRYVSVDETAALTSISFDPHAEISDESRAGVVTALDVLAEDGVDAFYSQEIATSFSSIFGPGEIIGIVIAAIVLLVMMGTLIAAGLPLLMAVVGVGIGVGGTLALSSIVEMVSITPMLALMLGLAVGIDYTLFIVHRHRQQLIAGMDLEESAGRAVGTSGNAVVFAGLTVVIALAALVVPGLPFLSILGLSAAATVAIAVLVSLTLTPALLGVIGSRLLSRRVRKRLAASATAADDAAEIPSDTERKVSPWVRLTSRRPWLVGAASVVLLAVVAIPAASMRTALPDGSQEPAGSSAQLAFEKTAQHFGAGNNGALVALVDLPGGLTEDQANERLLDVSDLIRPLENVVSVTPGGLNADRTAGLVQIVPAEGPSAESTEQLVHVLRDEAAMIEQKTDAQVNLAGAVAMQIDVSEKVTDALVPYLAIVVGLSLVLLLLVFRSIVVPLLATAGFLLSLAAGFGAAVAVYQWGWLGSLLDVHQPGPIMSFLPILLTGILFGLAMDYQVFLVSAMREKYAHGMNARDAVRAGFSATAPVVTAAALIMAAVFAGFVHSELTMIRPIGFALAVGVLADAFIVRMTLTPAIMTILGDRAWYMPRWLDRILPDVDVEGRKLGGASEN